MAIMAALSIDETKHWILITQAVESVIVCVYDFPFGVLSICVTACHCVCDCVILPLTVSWRLATFCSVFIVGVSEMPIILCLRLSI